MIGLPIIDIAFKKAASTAVSRSSRGIACLVIKDATDTTAYKEYTKLSDLVADKAKYTADNYNALTDAFLGSPSKLIAVRIAAADGKIDDALNLLINKSFNWMSYIDNTTADQTAVVTWVKAQNLTRTKKIKAVVYNATTPDDMHVVNFINTKVKRKADNAEIAGHLYMGRLAGLFAGLSMDMSATCYKLTDLESVTDVADIETQINGGSLALMNDEGNVLIARAVNSLKTLSEDQIEDEKFIAIVEAIDMMYEDIKNTFKNTYAGKFKNSLDNQILFISAINTYFKTLAADDVLDENYSNAAGINIDAQKKAWVDYGKTEALTWDDATVKNNTFKTNMYLSGDIKILNAIEDLSFNITME